MWFVHQPIVNLILMTIRWTYHHGCSYNRVVIMMMTTKKNHLNAKYTHCQNDHYIILNVCAEISLCRLLCTPSHHQLNQEITHALLFNSRSWMTSISLSLTLLYILPDLMFFGRYHTINKYTTITKYNKAIPNQHSNFFFVNKPELQTRLNF